MGNHQSLSVNGECVFVNGPGYDISHKSKLSILMANAQFLRELEFCENDELTAQELGLIVAGAPQLETLEITSCSAVTDASVRIIARRTSITELDIGGSDGVTNDSMLELHKMVNLRKLDVQCNPLTDIGLHALRSHPTLRVLNLRMVEELTDSAMESIASLPHLEIVDLVDVYKLTDRGIESLCAARSLTCIQLGVEAIDEDIAESTLFTDKSLLALSYLPGLKNLSLISCHHFTDDGMDRFSSTAPSIETLSLVNLGSITDRGIISVAMHLNNLERLNIAFTNVTARCAMALGNAHSLRQLQFGGGDTDMTDEGLAKIVKANYLTDLFLVHMSGLTKEGVQQAKNAVSGTVSVVMDAEACFWNNE